MEINQLASRLSEYLRRVKGEETFLITDREEVVAELGPCRRATSAVKDMDGLLEALAAFRRTDGAHEVTQPGLPKDRWTWRIEGAALPAGTAQTLLNDLRGDRRAVADFIARA